MSKTTRKDKIERTANRYRHVSGYHAWNELIVQLEALADPEAHLPKFRDLLVAIRRAGAKGLRNTHTQNRPVNARTYHGLNADIIQ